MGIASAALTAFSRLERARRSNYSVAVTVGSRHDEDITGVCRQPSMLIPTKPPAVIPGRPNEVCNELTWRGGETKKMESGYQLAINRMGRVTTGIFRTTPLGIAIAESKLTTAEPLLEYRPAKFMQRLMAWPKGHQGPEGILEWRESELTDRRRQNSFLRPDEKPGELSWERHRSFPEGIQIDNKADAYHTGG